MKSSARSHAITIGAGSPTTAPNSHSELQINPAIGIDASWLAGRGLSQVIKRVMDVAGSLTALIMVAPVMFVIAYLIRLTSPGPVFFRQARLGKDGRVFSVLKFRTMVKDAEQKLGAVEKLNQHADGFLFKAKDDPRVTPLGRFLRKTSLDELPQFINVLQGDMSLVGPRPLQLRDTEKLLEIDPKGYAARLKVMPGITGPWQVSGRSDTTSAQMVELDKEYAENWSIGRDILILLKTVVVVLKGRGAY